MFLSKSLPQFLVKLKIMDYSLLLGIHDVSRAEREEEDGGEVLEEEEPDAENGLAPGPAVSSYGTSPEGIAGYMSSCKPLGPGEFDPYVDVYALKSCPGKQQQSNRKILFTCFSNFQLLPFHQVPISVCCRNCRWAIMV